MSQPHLHEMSSLQMLSTVETVRGNTVVFGRGLSAKGTLWTEGTESDVGMSKVASCLMKNGYFGARQWVADGRH